MNLPLHQSYQFNANNLVHPPHTNLYPQISNHYHPSTYNPQIPKNTTIRPKSPIARNSPNLSTNNPSFLNQNKSVSQIIYKTQPSSLYVPSQPFHQSQIQQPIIIHPPPPVHIPTQVSQPHVIFQVPSSNTVPISRPNVMINRNLANFRNFSPINTLRHPQPMYNPQVNINRANNNKDLQKYDALRWQNKYEDLKTKYFQLLKVVQNNSHIQDSWLLQEENKLLRQKVRLLQQKDQKYYNQVTKRIQKLIDFHKQTTTQQCSLLIDRYRLENKFLQKM